MAFYKNGALTLHYIDAGDPDGFPVLLIAPGGMRSAMEVWARIPWNPLTSLGGFRLIAMDQRNAGQSTGPVSAADGWHTYTGDQLALLDHLGIERCHVLGMCIGGPYIMGLIKAAPGRIQSAVMLQPIGLDDNREDFYALFDAWAGELAEAHPEADAAAWASFREAMFGGTFMFNTSIADVAACQTPILLLRGDDRYHPASISETFAATAPNTTFVEVWKTPERLAQTEQTIKTFLHQQTPGTP